MGGLRKHMAMYTEISYVMPTLEYIYNIFIMAKTSRMLFDHPRRPTCTDFLHKWHRFPKKIMTFEMTTPPFWN